MKKESGIGVVGIILIVCFICGVAFGIYYFVMEKRTNEKDNLIKSDMLLIQGAGKVLYEDCIMNKTEDKLIGTKLSEIDKNENINSEIINTFKETNTIEKDKYEKYYVLTDDNLAELKIDVKNEENSYYIIGYEDDEVIFTKGYNDKYKLSEIDSDEETEENKEKNSEEKTKEETKEQESQEEKKEEDKEDKEE